VTSAAADLAVAVDERAEAFGFPTDDGDHERQPEHAGADERARCASDADPYGQRILQRTRVDGLTGERGAVLAGPCDVRVLAEGEEQIDLFGEKFVVVFESEAEQWVRIPSSPPYFQ
jgi:hypothetical protein